MRAKDKGLNKKLQLGGQNHCKPPHVSSNPFHQNSEDSSQAKRDPRGSLFKYRSSTWKTVNWASMTDSANSGTCVFQQDTHTHRTLSMFSQATSLLQFQTPVVEMFARILKGTKGQKHTVLLFFSRKGLNPRIVNSEHASTATASSVHVSQQ